eukprot:CAMPEP_0172665950 /NCGR_PEP_ID=MMETSP1074-20121228/7539_1 /TAXON_ID=2916 /ORGANISM="Ceratium fusus, Strain PA161109" /LENGTH=465 /DNA_ID=CAMNT_0013482305 /DNA_START=376 /DNA_END=1771 /DNA_ORIENTATION=+
MPQQLRWHHIPRTSTAPASNGNLGVPDLPSSLKRAQEVASWAVNRLTCWSDGCRVVLTDGGQWVQGSLQNGASATWSAMLLSEGQIIYNLFRRQLEVFIPAFDPSKQIEADLLMARSFILRDLNMSAAAFSVLIPLAPPGLNFTRFWVSDVRVSWKNLLSLDTNPIVLEIDSVQAAVAELAAGSDMQIESLIQDWLDVCGGVKPVPFQGKYPLLDGATFRVKTIHLDICSPTRYGNLSVDVDRMEILAADSEGRQQDLMKLCKLGLDNSTVTFSRLIDCRRVSVKYVDAAAGEVDEGQEKAVGDGESDLGSVFGESPHPARSGGNVRFLLAPTPLVALLTQKSCVEDTRRMLEQRWQLSFPAATRINTVPPLLTPAPEPPPQDRRLFPFPAPAAEWRVSVADGSQSRWDLSPFLPHRPQIHPIAAVVFTLVFVVIVLTMTTHITAKPWLKHLLAKAALSETVFSE